MFTAMAKRIKSIPPKLEKVGLASLKKHDNLVLDYITDVQLFEKGEDGQGNTLGTYAPSTIVIKQGKGQKTSNITLRDTGEYYSSYKLSIKGLVTADTQKPDQDLAVEFGEDIKTLSDKGMDVMIDDFLLEDTQDFVREQIC